MDEEKFILEVENYSALYDTTHPFYKDSSRKEKAWLEIAGVTGVPGELNALTTMQVRCDVFFLFIVQYLWTDIFLFISTSIWNKIGISFCYLQ